MTVVPATIVGLPVAAATMAGAIDRIVEAARRGEAGHVCCANVHMTTLARRDADLRAAMAGALLVTSDGMPLVWLLRRQHPWAERVAGPDLMAALLHEAAARGLPVYLLGGTEAVSAALAAALVTRWPGLAIAGRACPSVPERPGSDAALTATIRASGARLVFVGLGCPKQELWMAANAAATGALCLGVGQAFDVLAGALPRAPRWMQALGLEWLFRFVCEPRRLARRYLVSNALFICDVVTRRGSRRAR